MLSIKFSEVNGPRAGLRPKCYISVSISDVNETKIFLHFTMISYSSFGRGKCWWSIVCFVKEESLWPFVIEFYNMFTPVNSFGLE